MSDTKHIKFTGNSNQFHKAIKHLKRQGCKYEPATKTWYSPNPDTDPEAIVERWTSCTVTVVS